MTAADRLIDELMAAARIPFARRRREVLRELRAHMEDFVSAGRRSGLAEADIERLLAERFGDPRQIARQFAWVYRRERAALHLGAFLISTVLVSLTISAAAIAMQAGMAFGFGSPMVRVFGSRHTAIEALDILATAAAYVGLFSLGESFGRPLAVLAAVTSGLLVVFAAAGLPSHFVLFGFANGALLRLIQTVVRWPVARLGAVLACFGVLSAVFFHPSWSKLAMGATNWLIMGSAYHLMTHVTARVDRALAGRL
jgi:HAAS